MTSIVTEINIADIDRIASWFADQVPPLPVLPDEETGPGEQLYLTRGCVVCHSSDASADVEAPVPYLTSQHAQYLAKQIQDFQRGDRVHAGIEATDDPVAVLTENEIDQLVVHPFETF
jgi:cytochrome c553